MKDDKGIDIGVNSLGKNLILTDEDRKRSIHMMGMQGTGKTKFLEHLIRQDLRAGNGLLLLDIQGNLYRDLVRWLVSNRELNRPVEKSKIILVNPLEIEDYAVAFNPLDPGSVGETRDVRAFAHGVMDALLSVNDRGETDNRPPLISRVLSTVLHTAIEKKLTLLETRHLLSANDPFVIREFCTQFSGNKITESEWTEFNDLKSTERSNWFMGPINRLIEVIDTESMQYMISQTENTLDWLKFMDEGYVVLVNLQYNDVTWSYKNSQLLGRLFLNALTTRARFRLRQDGVDPKPFYCYIDECYEFVNRNLVHGLEALRQFGLRFVLSHQYLEQLNRVSSDLGAGIRSLTGTKICFKLGDDDYELMAKSLFLQDINLEEEKLTLRHKAVVGYQKETMLGGSDTNSQSHTDSHVSGEVSSWSSGSSESTTESQSYDNDGDAAGTGLAESSTESSSYSGSSVDMHTTSDSYSNSHTSSWSETYVPVLEDAVGGHFNLEEQFFRRGRYLANLKDRHYVMLRERDGINICTTPDVSNPTPLDKQVISKQIDYFDHSPYAMHVNDVRVLIEEREENLKYIASGLDTDLDKNHSSLEAELLAQLPDEKDGK